jgi:hypothetical protein
MDQGSGFRRIVCVYLLVGMQLTTQQEPERQTAKPVAEKRKGTNERLEISVVVVMADEQQLDAFGWKLEFLF